MEEAAALLGVHIQTLYKMIAKDKIGYTVVEKRKKIPETEIQDYIAEHSVCRRRSDPTPQELRSFEEFNRRYEKRRKKSKKKEVNLKKSNPKIGGSDDE